MKKEDILKRFLIDEGEFTEEELQEEITEGYRENLFDVCGREYLVLTEEEREKEVTENIKESLWAFNSSFLAGETDLPEEVFQALVVPSNFTVRFSERYESGNEGILKLIEKTCGLESLVDAATSADGYGHFLSPYDGEEGEVKEGNEWYYIYRIS